jgi:hypothetical protein
VTRSDADEEAGIEIPGREFLPRTDDTPEPDPIEGSGPGPEIPTLDSLDDAENPAEIRLFYKLVVVFNVALLALSVGPMLVYFEGNWQLGSRVFAVGAVIFAYGAYRYYDHVHAGKDEASGEADAGPGSDEPEGGAAGQPTAGHQGPPHDTNPRRVVAGPEGRELQLLSKSSDASRVLDPETGERFHLPNAEIDPLAGVSRLEASARVLPAATRTLLSSVHNERMVGLVVMLDSDGPLAARELLDRTELCESDLYGMVGELRAGGLLEEVAVGGERGYATTEVATRGLEGLRS